MFYEVLAKEKVSAELKAGADEILKSNEDGENIIVTSVITHLEVLPSKLQGKGVEDQADYLALFDAEKFSAIELNTNIILRAREIRDFYYIPPDEHGAGGKMMDLGDAIHLATASIHGANEFHTRDNDKKGSKIPLLSLYQISGHQRLCGKYELKIISPSADQGILDV